MNGLTILVVVLAWGYATWNLYDIAKAESRNRDD